MIEISASTFTLIIVASSIVCAVFVLYSYRFVQKLRSALGMHELYSAHIDAIDVRFKSLEDIVRVGLRDLAKETSDLRAQREPEPGERFDRVGESKIDVQAFGRSPLDAIPNIDYVVKKVLEAQSPELRIIQNEAILDPQERKRRLLVEKARVMCNPKACCNCKWWDHEGGQAAITQTNPVFMVAAQHIRPNTMGRVVKYDDTGAELPPDPKEQYPSVLNTWELFGACTLQDIGVHATDTCPSFEVDESISVHA